MVIISFPKFFSFLVWQSFFSHIKFCLGPCIQGREKASGLFMCTVTVCQNLDDTGPGTPALHTRQSVLPFLREHLKNNLLSYMVVKCHERSSMEAHETTASFLMLELKLRICISLFLFVPNEDLLLYRAHILNSMSPIEACDISNISLHLQHYPCNASPFTRAMNEL